MKKSILISALIVVALAGNAQFEDSIRMDSSKTSTEKVDTIHIGAMIIIRNGVGERSVRMNRKYSEGRPSTHWGILDLGFSNFNDQTNYGSQAAMAYTGNAVPAFAEGDFSLQNGKSFNINVWIVRQRIALIKSGKLNITYAVGIENTNYRYVNAISYKKGSGPAYVQRDTISFKKNKLAMSYFTLPVMLGFSTKRNGDGISFSIGASLGYMYSSRNKQISDERGKEKIKAYFGLRPLKYSIVSEVGLNSFRLYSSYSPQSIYKKGLDMRPFAVGVRVGFWN